MKKLRNVLCTAGLVMLTLCVVIGCSNPTSDDGKKPPVAPEVISGVVGQVSGVVYNTKTIQPIEGVTVELASNPVQTVKTDAAGVYVFKNVKPGTYTISFVMDGYQFRTTNVYIDPNQYWEDDPYWEYKLMFGEGGQLQYMNKWLQYTHEKQKEQLLPDHPNFENSGVVTYDWAFTPNGVIVNGGKEGDIAITVNKESEDTAPPEEYKPFAIERIKMDDYTYSKNYSLYVIGMAPLTGSLKANIKIFKTPFADTKNVTIEAKDIPAGVDVWFYDSTPTNVGWGMSTNSSSGQQPGYEDGDTVPSGVTATGRYGPAKTLDDGSFIATGLPVGVTLNMVISSFIDDEGFFYSSATQTNSKLYTLSYGSGYGSGTTGGTTGNAETFTVVTTSSITIQAEESGGTVKDENDVVSPYAIKDIGRFFLFSEGDFAYVTAKDLGDSGTPKKSDGKLKLTFNTAIDPSSFTAYISYYTTNVILPTSLPTESPYKTQLNLIPDDNGWNDTNTEVILVPADTIPGFFSRGFPYSKDQSQRVGTLFLDGYAKNGKKLYAASGTSELGTGATAARGFYVYTDVGLKVEKIVIDPSKQTAAKGILVSDSFITITFNKNVSEDAKFAWASGSGAANEKATEYSLVGPTTFKVLTNLLAKDNQLVYKVSAKGDPNDIAEAAYASNGVAYEPTRIDQYLTLLSTNIYLQREGSKVIAENARFPTEGDITLTFNKDITTTTDKIRVALYEAPKAANNVISWGIPTDIWEKKPTSIVVTPVLDSANKKVLTLKHELLKANTPYLLALDINNTDNSEALFNFETFVNYGQTAGDRQILDIQTTSANGTVTMAAIKFVTAKTNYVIKETTIYKLRADNTADPQDEYFEVGKPLTLTFNVEFPSTTGANPAKLDAVLVEDTKTVTAGIFNEALKPRDPNSEIVLTDSTLSGKVVTIVPKEPLKYKTPYKLALRVTQGEDSLFDQESLKHDDYTTKHKIVFVGSDGIGTISDPYYYTIRFTTETDQLKLLSTDIYASKIIQVLPVKADWANFPIKGKAKIELNFNKEIPVFNDANGLIDNVQVLLVRQGGDEPAPPTGFHALDSFVANPLIAKDQVDVQKTKLIITMPKEQLVHDTLYYLALRIFDKEGLDIFGQTELTKNLLPPGTGHIGPNYMSNIAVLSDASGFASIAFKTEDKTVKLIQTNIYDNRTNFTTVGVTSSDANFGLNDPIKLTFKSLPNAADGTLDPDYEVKVFFKRNIKGATDAANASRPTATWDTDYENEGADNILVDTAVVSKNILTITMKDKLRGNETYNLAVKIASKDGRNIVFDEQELKEAAQDNIPGKIALNTAGTYNYIVFNTANDLMVLTKTNIYDELKIQRPEAVRADDGSNALFPTSGTKIQLTFSTPIPAGEVEVLFADNSEGKGNQVNFIVKDNTNSQGSIKSFVTYEEYSADRKTLIISTPLIEDYEGNTQHFLAVRITDSHKDVVFDSTRLNETSEYPQSSRNEVALVPAAGITTNGVIDTDRKLISFWTQPTHFTHVRASRFEDTVLNPHPEITETSGVFSVVNVGQVDEGVEAKYGDDYYKNQPHKFALKLDTPYYIQFTNKTESSELPILKGVTLPLSVNLVKQSAVDKKDADLIPGTAIGNWLDGDRTPFKITISEMIIPGTTIKVPTILKVVLSANTGTASATNPVLITKPSAATGMVVGNKYIIASKGTTEWVPAGASASDDVGDSFVCAAKPATGNGTVYLKQTSIAATAMVIGHEYTIDDPGDLVWTALGAANDNPGTVFTCTHVPAAADGTGKVFVDNTVGFNNDLNDLTVPDPAKIYVALQKDKLAGKINTKEKNFVIQNLYIRIQTDE